MIRLQDKGVPMTKTLLALGAAALAMATAAQAQTYAITNARVMMTGTADDPRQLRDATVVVRDGEVVSVRQGGDVPRQAEVIDARGGVVTPGLFAAVSGLGLEEISLNGEANDRSARGNVGLSASIDAADGFYADSSVIPISRSRGVTRAYVAPDAGSSMFGGCGMLIDLSGGPAAGEGSAITDRCLAQTVSLGYSGAQRAGDSRPASIALLRRALDDALDYADDREGYARSYEDGRLPSRDAEALVPLLTGEQKMLAEVQGASDILRLLDLADEYRIDLVILGGAEAHRVAGRVAEAGVPVILDPLGNLPSRFETFGSTLEAAKLLEEAGVLVAFYDGDIGYTHNVRLLPQLAGNAVANGMSYSGALSAITLNPARIWGRDDLGMVAPGMTADLVVWDGDPLEVTTRATAVLIDGEAQDLDDRQKALTRRYRDLAPRDKPFAYRND